MMDLFDFYNIPNTLIPRVKDEKWNSLFYMDSEDINFSRGGSVYAYYQENLSANFKFAPHSHNFLEMKIFLDEKNLTEVVEDRKFEIKARDILFVNQNEVHYTETADGSVKRIIIGFSPSFIDETIQDTGSEDYFINYDFLEFFFRRDTSFPGLLNLNENAFKRLLAQCCQVLHTLNLDCAGKKTLLRNNVLSMLSCFLTEYRALVPPLEKSESRISTIMFYIQNNFKKHITISDLAEKFYISKSHLYEVFKEGTGTSLSLYMNNLRLQKAKTLLLTTRQNITQIAFDSGFQDISYFNRLFRKKYGVSPRNFRDNHSPVQ